LPPLRVKAPSAPQRLPGYKPPSRGITRYPWAIGLTLLVIAVTIFSLYYFQAGPFAKPKPVVAVKHVVLPDLKLPNPSPCLKLEKQLTDTAPAPDKATIAKIVHSYSNAPSMFIDTNAFYCVGINTNRGLIVVELDPHYAPATVNNFVFLAENHFYDGLTFPRVVPGFVIQAGSPSDTTSGGPGYKFNDEPVYAKYTEGVIAMANSGANTNGSQFFITLANDSSTLKPQYNLFGRVVAGINVALKIQGPDPDNGKTNIKADVINHIIVIKAS
jgi:peptidylprolyl isomerase